MANRYIIKKRKLDASGIDLQVFSDKFSDWEHAAYLVDMLNRRMPEYDYWLETVDN